MPESTGRYLCIINYNSCNGWICVPSEGEREGGRSSNYCEGTGGCCQREMAGCNIKYPAEVMVTFAVSFLYRGKG